MFSNMDNMLVAQNCIEYNPMHIISLLSVSAPLESCTNCKNFIKGKCSKELHNEIKEMINRN